MKKRILAMLLAVMMVVGLFPVSVFADNTGYEAAEQTETAAVAFQSDENTAFGSEKQDLPDPTKPGTMILTRVNPAYEGIYTEQDIRDYAASVKANSRKLLKSTSVSGETYYSPEEAVTVLREWLVKRTTSFSLNVLLEDTTDTQDILDAVDLIMDGAFAETENGNEGGYLRMAYSGYDSSISYMPSTDENGFYVTYNMTFRYNSTSAEEAEIDEKLAQIYEELALDTLDSDMKKFTAVYQYITTNIRYNYAALEEEIPHAHSAYGALFDGTCVCQGYSQLLYRMCRDNGIPALVITGKAGSAGALEAHAWNAVKIGNTYYFCDSTWDEHEGGGNTAYFLRGVDDFDAPNASGMHYMDEKFGSQDFNDRYPISASHYTAEPHTHTDADIDNLCDFDGCFAELYVDRSWDGTKVIETFVEIPDDAVKVNSSNMKSDSSYAFDKSWYVIDGEVSIARLSINRSADDPVHIILKDGSSFTMTMGVELTVGNGLVVYGQSMGTGRLDASITYDGYAGIGGDVKGTAGGSFTVKGGSISAAGGYLAAGIGGGYTGAGCNFKMYGGTVEAVDGTNAAGIGAGNGSCNHGEFEIYLNVPVIAAGADSANAASVTDYSANRTSYVRIQSAAAKYNGVNYLTLSEAVQAANENGTVILLGNCSEDIVIGKGLKIDTNGFGFTGSVSASFSKLKVSTQQDGTVISYTLEHIHTFTYTADGNAVIAECTNTDSPCGLEKASISAVITAAENSTYSGMAVTASVDSEALSAVTGMTAAIQYFQGTTKLNGAPVNAGTYTAKLILTDAENNPVKNAQGNVVTASADFTISKASVAVPAANEAAFVYDGNEKTYLNIADNALYQLADDSAAASRINAGTTTVKLVLKDTDNYEWADNADDPSYTFVIAKAEQVITAEETQRFGFGDSDVSVSAAAEGTLTYSVKSGDSVAVDDSGKLSIQKQGDTIITVIAAETENYKSAEKDITISISLNIPVPHTHGQDADAITFQPWNSGTTLPDEEGNWFLTEDVVISKAWIVPKGTTNLCLNGHIISQTASEKRIINIRDGCTLNIYDCDETEHYGHISSDLWVPDTEKTSNNISVYGGYMIGGNVSQKAISMDGMPNGTYSTGRGGAVYIFGGGTLNLYGGNIVGNTAGWYGGAVYADNGIFNIYGGSVTGNLAKCSGGGIYIISREKAHQFTMSGGKIANNRSAVAGSYNGGAIWMENMCFTMSGGTISGNKSRYGGGVQSNGSTDVILMTGGEISDNISTTGGGGINVSGKLIMSGGIITRNISAGNNGGGVRVKNAGTEFIMSGGLISDNTTSGNGGGIFVEDGKLTLNDSTVSGNAAKNGGGVYVSSGSIVTMGNSTVIRDNKAIDTGGGVYVYTNGTFTMNTGTVVEGNENTPGYSDYGAGGIAVCGGKATLNGGIVRYNTTEKNGGGVLLEKGTLDLLGVKITNNNANTGNAQNGGGMYLYGDGTLVIGKDTQITGNVNCGTIVGSDGSYTLTGGTDSNLYLPSGKIITINTGENAPVTTGENAMNVGITMQSGIGVFTGGNNADYHELFTPDAGADYKVINLTNDSNKLKLIKKYIVTVADDIQNGTVTTNAVDNKIFEGDTVMVTVISRDGYKLTAGSLKAYKTDDSATTVSLMAGQNNTYTFTMPDYAVTVTATFEHTHSFTYTADGTVLTAVCVADGCGLTDKKVTLTLTAEDVFYDGMVYNDASTDDTVVKFAETTGKTVTIEYWTTGDGAKKLDSAPTNAGNYAAKVTVGNVTAQNAFTIQQRPVTLIAGNDEKVYDGDPLTCTAFTVKEDTTTEGYGFIGEEGIASVTMTAESTITNVGSADNVIDTKIAKVSTNLDNYDISSENGTLTIKPAKENAPAENEGYTLDYAAETLKAVDGYEVSSADSDTVAALTNDKVEPGDTEKICYVRKLASDSNHAPSAWTAITIPSRPATPPESAFTVTEETAENKKDGSVSGITDAMEYSMDGGATWISGPAALENLSDETVTVRTKATDTSFSGEEFTYTFTASDEKLTIDINGTETQAVYGDKLTKPAADPEKSGYTFGGWYSDEECKKAWNFELDTVKDNLTLYPKWIKDNVQKAVISGRVTENGGVVPGVVVELFLGIDKIAATVTDTNGDYSFDNVENGTYNIVVTDADGKIKTALVTVNTTGNFPVNVELPEKTINSVVKITDNTGATNKPKVDFCRTVVGGLDEIVNATTLDDGENVTIKLIVEPKDETAENAESIKTLAGSGKVEFFDLTLMKTVNGENTPDFGSTNTQLLTIVIPFDFTGVKVNSVKVLRYHDDAEMLTKDPAADKEGFTVDTQNGTITICAKQFSTYAVVYEEERNDPYIPDIPVAPSYSVIGEDTENGKLIISRKSASANQTVTVTVTPDEGYELDTMTVKDKKGNVLTFTEINDTTYGFRMPSSDVTISATFVKLVSVCPQDETCVYAKFTDSDTKAWYHDGVHFCVENGYMKGISDTQFAPAGTNTRAMIVTILWRMEGEPIVDYAMSFADVPADEWYTEAIRWAQSADIVKGYSAEAFGPNDPITREQMATILYRFAKNHGIDVTNTNTLAGFTDVNKVSDWALDAMKWANAAGLVLGRTTTTLVPEVSITRVEAAAMVQRYCEKLRED